MVTVNRQIENSQIPAVVNDDAGGIAEMLRYLYDAGHRRIAHIAGPPSLSTGRERTDAFKKTAQDLGLDTPPEAIATASHYDEAEGRKCTSELLGSGRKFSAILCANDRLALGSIDELGANGLSCPDDISVTGFNDIPFLDHIPPGLTTIRVQQFDVGRIGAELLLRMMNEPEAAIPMTTIFPVKLIERGSVAKIPTA
jgi:LacI family transcriptional regulator